MIKRVRYDAAMPSQTFDHSDYEGLRATSIPATLAGVPSMRFDSAEDASVFFARELDFIKSQTYDVLYPELTAIANFPQSSEVDPGSETVTYYSYEKTGFAKIIQNYATDLPRADVKGKPTTVPIRALGASYGYSIQEMRASRLAGKSLDVRKGESARYAIEREINRIAWAGDESGLVGVLSPDNNVPLYVLPNNAAGSTRWVDKSAEEILEDVKGMIAGVATSTMDVERPDTLALPSDAFLHIAHTPLNPLSNYTILKWILENIPDLKKIIRVPELNGNSGVTPYPGEGVAFLYTNDPQKFTIETPMPFYQHPVQPKGLEFEVPCEARVGGAMIYYPLSMLIAVGV